MDNNDTPTAHIGIYGSNINFQPGRRIKMSEQNEYVMCLPMDFTDSDLYFFVHSWNRFLPFISTVRSNDRFNQRKGKIGYRATHH